MKVLAALDRDPAAQAVLEAGRRLAQAFQADLEANHVGEDGESAVQSLAAAASVQLRLLSGSPAETLAGAFSASDTLLGVLGSRGRPGEHEPLGGTTLEVIQLTRTPLVVVSPHMAPGQPLQRVLAPLDGSEATAEAVQEVVLRLCASGVQLIVLHVFDKEHVPQFMDHMPEALETWTAEFIARYFEECEVTLETWVGGAPAAVLEIGVRERADMILLSWAQDLSPGRANLVRQVLRRAKVPIMLVPLIPGARREVLEPSG
jgi:nucleotide-binding universal stress UspA family protein